MGMITLGPLSLPLLPLLLLAGMITSLAVARRWPVMTPQIESAIYAVVFIGLFAARLGFVILHRAIYARTPIDILDIRDGGFMPLVGIAAGVVATAWYVLRKPYLTRVLLPCLVAGVAITAIGGVAAWSLRAPVRLSLPTTALTDIDGKEMRLDRLRGKPVVVNLWATWCPPCRREMPVLQHAQATVPGAVFVFANQGETVETVRKYLDSEHIAIANVVMDRKLEIARLAGSNALPVTLFFDAKGNLRNVKMGSLSAATLVDELRGILPDGG